MRGPIPQAKNVPLSQTSSMPQQDTAVDRLLSPLVFERIQETLVEGLVQKLPVFVSTLGSIQPFTDRQLSVKPEGERAWSWYQIHTQTNFKLDVNERIKINGVRYKVMALRDYSRNAFYEYHIIEDFGGDDTGNDFDNSTDL